MTLQITGKNVDAGDTYQTYVSDKIRTVLKKYLGREYDGHVRLEKVRGLFKTNCSVRLASGLLLEAQAPEKCGDAALPAVGELSRVPVQVFGHATTIESRGIMATAVHRLPP